MLAAALVSGIAFTACSSSTVAPSERSTTVPVVSVPEQRPEVVDGVPLIPISAVQRSDCLKFADRLKRQVPCPGLLPKPIPVSSTSPNATCLGTLGEAACGPAVIQVTNIFLLSQSNFQVPPGYVGVTYQEYNGTVVPEPSVDGGSLGHFVFTAGGPHVPAYCSPMPVEQPVQVHGRAATLYQCSDSSTAPGELQLIMGHDLLVWDDAGITTEVSFHGHSQVNVDLDLAVANATSLVSPLRG
jgi:hypothetical protein